MSHKISLQEAISMTTAYRNLRESILLPEYRDKATLAVCETFHRSAVDRILAEQGCEKLRIYYGMDEDQRVHAILVGVNANDEDILPLQTNSLVNEEEEDEELLAERAFRCPPTCPPSSDLNP